MSVVPLEAAKTHLGITSDTSDLELQDMLDRAEAAIAKQVGPLAPTMVTSTIAARQGIANYADSWDARSLVLPERPVISLTSVTGSSGTVVDPSLLVVTKAGILYYADGYSRFYEMWYTVVYEAGRESLPDDLVLVVLELTRHLWETQRGAANRTGGVVDSGLAATLPGSAYTFPARITELLMPYQQAEL